LHPDIARVKELQAVDHSIGSLTARIEIIPSQIKQIEDQLNAFIRALDEHKQRLAANQKDRRDLDADTQMIRARISKHRDQLYQMKTNEQYRAMLHEIEGEEAKIRGIEDRILDKMAEAEELETYVHDAAARLEGERSRVAAEKQQFEKERAADEAARAQAEERRSELAAALSASTLQLYERARKARGTAVVEVVDGSCAGCHVKLRPQYFNEVRGSDDLHACESCGRILYYTGSAVDHAVEGTRVVMSTTAESTDTQS
jgi:uncharacterized protein